MRKAPEPIRSWTWPHYQALMVGTPLLCRLLGGWRVVGRENVPATRGAVIAPNHVSYLDPPAVGSALPRRVYSLAKKELFEIPIFGWIIRKCYAFPVNRESNDVAAFRHAIRVLQAGELLLVFPEGARSRDGSLEEGGLGAALIASRAGVPIIPCALHGTDRVLPRGAWHLHRGLVQVSFGDLISLDEYPTKRLNKQQLEEVTARVMSSIAQMHAQQEDFATARRR